MSPRPLLRVNDLTKTYGGQGLFSRGRPVQAVSGVSFEIGQGETLALVGESGCGKSSVGRMVMRLTEPSAGSIEFDGRDLAILHGRALAAERHKIQMVFQDPFGSLNPRKAVRHILRQPLRAAGHRGVLEREVLGLLDMVGLRPPERFIDRLPHEFSGGQRQRIAIARAFAMKPRLVVADEPVSALDVSVRAQVLRLMQQLQAESGVSFLFISHDLGVVRSIAQRVAVMYLGKLVESGPVEDIFTAPRHPYTQALLSASPLPDPARARERQRILLQGDLPSPSAPPPGCRFHTRCPVAQGTCRQVEPLLITSGPDHLVACHLVHPVARQ